MSEAQTQHLFHVLQREHRHHSRPLGEPVYRRLLATTAEHVRLDPITEARRISLNKRLADALSAPVPADRMLYAMLHIRARLSEAQRNQQAWEARIASRAGLDVRDVHNRFRRYMAEVPTGRHVTPDDYTDEHREYAALHGLLDEEVTVSAAARVEADTRTIESDRARLRPRRIIRTVLTEPAEVPDVPVVITEVGYDVRNRRLEIATTPNPGSPGLPGTFAYMRVPPQIAQRVLDNPTEWGTLVRGVRAYEYPDSHTEAVHGSAPRCDACGQWADTTHTCPASTSEPVLLGRASTQQRWSRAVDPVTETSVLLPTVRELHDVLHAGHPVHVTGIHETITTVGLDGFPHHGTLTGTLMVYPTGQADRPRVSTRNVACTCRDYQIDQTCGHVTVLQAAAAERVAVPLAQTDPVVIAEIAERAQTALATDWTLNPEWASEAAATWHPNRDVTYSENFNAFWTDASNTNALPFHTSTALTGLHGPGTHPFGFEIEYDFPTTMTDREIHAANIAIGQALYDAGLTGAPGQRNWHAAHGDGFTDRHTRTDGTGTWSFEIDRSVTGGEIITPGCYDEPDTWERLALVCRILNDHGATTSSRTGFHVHVGTPSFVGKPGAYAELARLFTQHEDVLYRLSSAPGSRGHRPLTYCAPNQSVPPSGFASINGIRQWHRARYYALNLSGVAGTLNDHPEFRLFDASLDPAVIQAQIKLATHTTAAALRIHDAGIITGRPKEPVGAHARRGAVRGRRRLTTEDHEADTATTRSFLDTVFATREDKALFAQIYTQTRWARERIAPSPLVREDLTPNT